MEEDKQQMRELAAAMNNLAGALQDTNNLVREAIREDSNWNRIPSILFELNKRLMMLSTRI